jgi:hypothetical protein
LENVDRPEYSEILFDPGKFLTHIMLDVTFSMHYTSILHVYVVYQENMHILQLSLLYLLHMNSDILRKNVVLNMLIKWDL